MKKRELVVITLYGFAVLIVLSWIFLCSFDDIRSLSNKGINNSVIQDFPKVIRQLYKGFPSKITLICYVFFTISAFAFIKEERKLFKFIKLSSFVMILWLLTMLS
jgi:hypothetical protein